VSDTVQDPRPLRELAAGLALARGGPGRTLNVYLLGDVVVDAGVRWSRRLARQLAGRQLSAHVLSHAHFDHAGCSAWLCRTFDLPLWCGQGDAAAISSGRVDSHGSPLVNRLQRTLAPVAAHPVTRTLWDGDLVGGFAVLEVPGHSPGGAGILAGAGPGASLRRRGGQLRPASQPTAAGAGAGGAVLGRRPEPALGCSPGRAAAPVDLLRARLCGHRPGQLRRRRPPTPGSALVTAHGGLRQAGGPHVRTPHRRQRRKAEQPAESPPARPRTGVLGWVRAAGRR